jgi:hypothetical protein
MLVRRINQKSINIRQEIGDTKEDYINLIEMYKMMGYVEIKTESFDKVNALSCCTLALVEKIGVDKLNSWIYVNNNELVGTKC